MMKKIIAAFILLLFVSMMVLWSAKSFGQSKIYYAAGRTTDTAFTPGAWLLNGIMRATYYATSDTNKVLGVDANGFLVLRTKTTGGSGWFDTTEIYNQLGLRVRYTDTAAMLSPYYRTATATAALATKQAYSDTTTWDATKKNLADTAAVLRSLVTTGVDTTSLSDRINARVKYTDTAAMLAPYIRSGAIGVTVQPYNANTTLLGNSTTGTGPIVRENSPALLLPSIAAINVSGGIAALPTGSGTLMYRGDTTAMLLPYVRGTRLADSTAVLRALIPAGTDTTSLSNRIDQRVKYTDTAAMLSPYLRDADTGSLSNRINLRIDSIRRLPGSTTVQMKINNTWVTAYTDSVGGGSSSGWALTGNAGTTAGTNFVGTTDNVRFDVRSNNTIFAKFYPNGAVALNELSAAIGPWGFASGYASSAGASNHATAIGLSTQANALRSTAIGPNSQVNSVDGMCFSSGTGDNETVTGGGTYGHYGGARIVTTGTAVTVGRVAGVALGVTSTVGAFLHPVMTNAQKGAIVTPAAGYTVYCSDCTATDASTGVVQTYNGTTWKNHW